MRDTINSFNKKMSAEKLIYKKKCTDKLNVRKLLKGQMS